MRLLAIDPGNSTGWAEFLDGTLIACGACDPLKLYPANHPQETVIEKPESYSVRFQKGDQNDLITLAVTVGRLVERFSQAKVTQVIPKDWKGQLPKDVCWRNAVGVLRQEELIPVTGMKLAAKPLSDMRDAVALGLWYLGRLKFK